MEHIPTHEGLGWHHNPSAWSHRWYIGILVAAGFVVSTFLALYEWRMTNLVWEPFFGGGSHYILRESAVSVYFLQTFGYPDAFFGAAAYLAEMLLAGMEGPNRWWATPWIPIVQGLLALAMAVAGIGLTLAQAFVFHQWCTMCLVSAAISLLIVPPAVDELWAALRFTWRRRHGPVSLWSRFWGTAH